MALTRLNNRSLAADADITADKLDVGQLGGRRNLIINGDMNINQRGDSSRTSSGYLVDRFRSELGGSDWAGTFSVEDDAPPGFKKSIKFTTTSTASDISLTTRYVIWSQKIEGYNTVNLAYGTAEAKPLTLSFWIKSSVVGSWFSAGFRVTGYGNYQTVNITQANTWQKVEMTFPGNTSAALGDSTSGIGMELFLSPFAMVNNGSIYSPTQDGVWEAGNFLASSSSTGGDFVQTNGSTVQITGVQLEVGSVATPFEHRSYGEELALCQRYYQNSWGFYGSRSSSTQWQGPSYNFNTGTSWITAPLEFAVQMRANPSMTNWDNAGNQGKWTRSTWAVGSDDNQNGGWTVIRVHSAVAYSDGTANRAHLQGNWQADAEL